MSVDEIKIKRLSPVQLERLTANARVLGSIPASTDTVESEADEAVLNKVH